MWSSRSSCLYQLSLNLTPGRDSLTPALVIPSLASRNDSRGGTMRSGVPLRADFKAVELRALAKRAEDADQARRLLSLAAVLGGMSRKAAAEIGAMDRQTLRELGASLQRARP